MILYEYFCVPCDQTFEAMARQSDIFMPCKSCATPAKRCPSFRGTISVFHEHWNEGLGQYISGASQLRDICKANNLIQMKPGDNLNPSRSLSKKKEFQNARSKESIERFIRNSGIADLINDREPIPRIKETLEQDSILKKKGIVEGKVRGGFHE